MRGHIANHQGEAVPDGLGDEEAIRDIRAADSLKRHDMRSNGHDPQGDPSLVPPSAGPSDDIFLIIEGRKTWTRSG